MLNIQPQCSEFVFQNPLLLMKNVFISDTFHINPQLHLILSEMEEVIVSLNQHSIMEPKVGQNDTKWPATVNKDCLCKLLGF
jgi:hypothetical protein